MSFTFFQLGIEHGGRPVVLVKRIDVPKAGKEPYKEVVNVYTVRPGMVFVSPFIVFYSENEVAQAKLLQDGAPLIIFERVWGNNAIQPVRLVAETSVDVEIVNDTAQVDTLWIKISGVEIPRESLAVFIKRLKELGVGFIC